jgi:glyoxylase-like metal-dependent hydrolase (beta-lactamase superfamily II)
MTQSQFSPVDMGNHVWLIDLYEQNQPFRTGAYLIEDEELTLIETGSATSHDVLIHGLAALGYSPADLRYVIVTHVHLDHAGGAGHLMEKAPNAKLVVHPRGARHMIDPSRLWEGAKQVYQDKIADYFGSIKPVPKEQIIIKEHGETLNIGERTLTFFDSPGHAKHHFTILDPVANALYAGDAIGIRYRKGFTNWDFEFIMPSSSPVDFDPEAVHNTLAFLKEQPFEWVYHAHFGRSPKEEAIEHTNRVTDVFANLVAKHYHKGVSVFEIEKALQEWVVSDLEKRGLHPGDIHALDIDVLLDAMGLIYYYEHKKA